MKTIFLSITLWMFVGMAFSQVPVGYRFDVNGIPFNGYYDVMTYAPEKKLTEKHMSDSYEVGYYYDASGNKVSGNIKFQGKKIFFKQGKEEFRDKIKPEEVKTFVIGVDSFFTISKYYLQNNLKTEPVYVQFIAAFDNAVFAKHYSFPGNGVVSTYLIKTANSDAWENFPDNKTFKQKALKYFGHISYLKDKIESGKYKSDDMLAIIKMADYLRKYEDKREIWYDQYWEETSANDKVVYRANIVAKEDSIWTFDYYAGATRLYQVKYSAFFPNLKNGELTCYYPSGSIRQTILYKNNKMKEVKTFTTSGLLDRHYEVVEVGKDKKQIEYKYLVVNDASGSNILKPGVRSNIDVRDEVNGFTYTNVFHGSKLIYSYRLENSDTVFQIVNPDDDISLKALNRNFSIFMTDKKYETALSVNAQGKLLVALVVDSRGYVSKATILNKLHPEIDKLIADLIRTRLLEGEVRYKIDIYKKDKIARYYEVIIPIDFSAYRFYRQPVDYGFLNQMHVMNQHMMMMQMAPPVAPPSFH